MHHRSKAASVLAPWKILIADDDKDIHAATRMALRGAQFRGRSLEFIDAYSGEETMAVLQENPDVAIVFLDVIMETDDAGLSVAKRIREDGFNLIRIIIRTGFPGQAPERKIIVEYDIHDYKEKTGLSVQKLFTSVISALRAYDDLVALENHRRGLLSVLESVSWFDFNAVARYLSGMLATIYDIAGLDSEGVVIVSRRSANAGDTPTLIASLGDWHADFEPTKLEEFPPEAAALVRDSLDTMQALSAKSGETLFAHNFGIDLVVFATGPDAFSQADEVLLDVFLNNVCQAIANQQTFTDMVRDRDAVLRALALSAERRADYTVEELEQLSGLVTKIAERLHDTLIFPEEIDERFLADIGIASMLHDLGNESISATLLAKNAPYTFEERALMQTHVEAGTKALEKFLTGASETGALSLAREIIACHHERFDGSGYPQGLIGDAIPLPARLVALADAYISMISPRPHRSAMESSAACAAMRAAAGNQFDPRMVTAFFEVVDCGLVIDTPT